MQRLQLQPFGWWHPFDTHPCRPLRVRAGRHRCPFSSRQTALMCQTLRLSCQRGRCKGTHGPIMDSRSASHVPCWRPCHDSRYPIALLVSFPSRRNGNVMRITSLAGTADGFRGKIISNSKRDCLPQICLHDGGLPLCSWTCQTEQWLLMLIAMCASVLQTQMAVSVVSACTGDCHVYVPQSSVVGFSLGFVSIHASVQVRVAYRPTSVEMWAIGASAAYHIHLPKLYQVIVPERCTFKANSQRQKVYLLLHKQADAEWRFLKG